MSSNQKPSLLVRRGFVIVLSLTLLFGFIALVVPNTTRTMKSTKSTQVLTDLRMLDAAIDRYVIESQKREPLSPALAESLDSVTLKPSSDTRGVLEEMDKPRPVLAPSSKLIILPGTEAVKAIELNLNKRPVIMSSSKSGAVITPGGVESFWGDELSRIINRQPSPSK